LSSRPASSEEGQQNPPQNIEAERRSAPRIMVQLAAAAREPGQEKVGVQIVDLSPQGCRIEMGCNAFGEQWVLLMIHGFTPQYCRIVWQEPGFAGLEFTSPLDRSAFDNLVAQVRTTKQAISALRSTGDRARLVAKRTIESPGKRALVSMSQDCFMAALVKTFEMGNARKDDAQLSQLTSGLVKRSID
jgi:PilZ domain-containing protein